jgi:RNA recognition motif-containing protein
MGNNLFVTGFPYDLSEADLAKLFAPSGQVLSAKILVDRMTGRSRGLGFVLMATDEEARAAIASLDGSDVGHRKIFVHEARPAEKTSRAEQPAAPAYTGPERRSGRDRRRAPPAAERKPWDKDRKPAFGDKKPWGKKPWDKDKKPAFGDKKPWEKKGGDSFPKKKWSAGGPGSGRKPGDRMSKPGGFKRRPSGGFRG